MHIKAKRKESLRSLFSALQKMGKEVEKVGAKLKKGRIRPENAK